MDFLSINNELGLKELIELFPRPRSSRNMMFPQENLWVRSMLLAGEPELENIRQLALSLNNPVLQLYMQATEEHRGPVYLAVPTHNHPNLLPPSLVIHFDDTQGDMTFSVWEHPVLNRIPTQVFWGRYYGYSECCIRTFMDQFRVMHTDRGLFEKRKKRSEGYACVVCDDCAEKSAEEVEVGIQKRRLAQYPVNQEVSDSGLFIREQLHMLLCLQQGQLTHEAKIYQPEGETSCGLPSSSDSSATS